MNNSNLNGAGEVFSNLDAQNAQNNGAEDTNLDSNLNSEKQDSRPKLAYILPNFFTASSAFLGVISVLCASRGDYDKAIIYIVFSLILDGMDGRVARLTKTTSKFGVEFDSLADLVAFGVAPAMLFYFSVGHTFGKFGSLVAALFVVFGAIRLARFNVTTGTYEPNVFIGLPIPSAAITAAFWVGIYENYGFLHGHEWILSLIMAVLSILMVSNVRYPSFKKINYAKANFLRLLIALLLAFSLLYVYPLESATAAISVYIVYGVVRGVWVMFFAKNIKLKKE